MKILISSNTDQIKMMANQPIPAQSTVKSRKYVIFAKVALLLIFFYFASICFVGWKFNQNVQQLNKAYLQTFEDYRQKLDSALSELTKVKNSLKEPTYDDLLRYYRAEHDRPTLKDDRCSIDDKNRYDCDPSPNASKQQCLLLGCCWKQPNHKGKPF